MKNYSNYFIHSFEFIKVVSILQQKYRCKQLVQLFNTSHKGPGYWQTKLEKSHKTSPCIMNIRCCCFSVEYSVLLYRDEIQL